MFHSNMLAPPGGASTISHLFCSPFFQFWHGTSKRQRHAFLFLFSSEVHLHCRFASTVAWQLLWGLLHHHLSLFVLLLSLTAIVCSMPTERKFIEDCKQTDDNHQITTHREASRTFGNASCDVVSACACLIFCCHTYGSQLWGTGDRAEGSRDGSTARLHNEDDDADNGMAVPLPQQLCASAGESPPAHPVFFRSFVSFVRLAKGSSRADWPLRDANGGRVPPDTVVSHSR